MVTYIFNTSGASDRVPVIEFGDFTAVNNSDEPITNFIVNDEEKKRKRTAIKRDNFSKKECTRNRDTNHLYLAPLLILLSWKTRI